MGHCQKICFLCFIGQSHWKPDRIGFGAEIAAMGYHCCLPCALSEFVCGTYTAECLLFYHGIRCSCYLRDWCGAGVLLQRTGGITGGIDAPFSTGSRAKDFVGTCGIYLASYEIHVQGCREKSFPLQETFLYDYIWHRRLYSSCGLCFWTDRLHQRGCTQTV